MNQYTFLIGWMAHSDGACGEDTGIHSANDLERLYKENSEFVSSYDVVAENVEQAYDKGYRCAFFDNFTANDSMSILLEKG